MSNSRTRRLFAEALEGRDVPATAFALGTGANAGNLFRFDTATPGTATTLNVSGITAGDTLVGIDFRPANGLLYGVGANLANNSLTVYTIDLTGAATPVGAPAVLPAGNTIAGAASFGVDFNPVPDRIRVVTDLPTDGIGGNANNLRLNPNTGALVAIDTDLDFTGLPVGAAPETGVAYINSQFGPTPGGTQLFGIVTGTDQLVTNGGTAPGFPTLAPVGALGVATDTNNVGFDIFGPNNGTASTAIASLSVAGVTSLYTISLTTGAATLVGPIGNGTLLLSGLTVAPPPLPVVASGQTNGAVTPLVPVGGQLTTGTAVTAFANSSADVRSTAADVNGDGIPDIISVTGPGVPLRVNVISGVDNTTVLLAPFAPFSGSEDFSGGGFVAAVDFDGDGRSEFVVTPDQGGGPRVTIFSLQAGQTTATVRANFIGITGDDAFRGGVRPAVGDVNGDGTPDLVIGAGFLGGPRVAVFNGVNILTAAPVKLINDFFAFTGTDVTNLRNGVFVTLTDINGDGASDFVFGGGPGGAPRVFILSGAVVSTGDVTGAQNNPLANFFVAGDSSTRGGVRVSFADIDGDTRGDLVVASGEGRPAAVRAYLGKNFTTTAEPTTFQDLSLFGGATLAGGVFVG